MASFQDLIQRNPLVLIDFSATWCGPCQMLAPVLKEVKDTLGNQLTILKIDVDKNQALAGQMAVRGVPTLILYHKGEQVWRQSGALSKSDLLPILQRYTSTMT